MYGDPLRNYLGLIDMDNLHTEDNLQSINFSERAHVVDKLRKLLGFKHVQGATKIQKSLVLFESM